MKSNKYTKKWRQTIQNSITCEQVSVNLFLKLTFRSANKSQNACKLNRKKNYFYFSFVHFVTYLLHLNFYTGNQATKIE